MPEEKKQGGSNVLVQTFREFSDDECTTLAASIAYYTIFSLPALMVIIATVAGLIWGADAVQGAMMDQAGDVVGKGGKEQLTDMMKNANKPGRGILASTIGVIVLVFGATGVVAQLQTALNRAWEVEPDPQQGGIKNFIMKRILSLGMILGLAFLLMVSLALSTLFSAGVGLVAGNLSQTMGLVINNAVSLVVFALLFAAMFKWLPDAEVRWGDVAIGAIATAILFLAGKFLIGLYIGQQDPGAYGAAGSLVLILVWVYYSSLILLFGAEFTQVWANRYGRGIKPEEGAVRVVERKEQVQNGSEPGRSSSGEKHGSSERSAAYGPAASPKP